MPQVGQDVPSAIIVEWLMAEGDSVEAGDVILVVESDKATFEVEAEVSGVLTKILYEAGTRVDVFQPIAYISSLEEADETTERDIAIERDGHLSSGNQPFPRPSETDKSSPTVMSRISPAAKRLAREERIDLSQLKGTGPGGRIVAADVSNAIVQRDAEAKSSETRRGNLEETTPDRTEIFTSKRKTIAGRMSLSSQSIPHFFLSIDVNMSECMIWRKDFNARNASTISITDLIVKAVSLALQQFPVFNAFVETDRMVLKGCINIGVATQSTGGLMVPVIPDANRKTLAEIANINRTNADLARRGQMSLDHEATFTVTSLGMYGVRSFQPIINPPQCAILAVGAVELRVVPIDRGMGIHDTMTLTLGADHRAVDGAEAAEFLNALKHYLEAPELLANSNDGLSNESTHF